MNKTVKKWFGQAFPAADTTQPGEITPEPGSPEAVLHNIKGMLSPVSSAYRRQFRRNGATPKGVFWSNPDNVRKRFEVLC